MPFSSTWTHTMTQNLPPHYLNPTLTYSFNNNVLAGITCFMDISTTTGTNCNMLISNRWDTHMTNTKQRVA